MATGADDDEVVPRPSPHVDRGPSYSVQRVRRTRHLVVALIALLALVLGLAAGGAALVLLHLV